METLRIVKGTVKWFSHKKGYGFITTQEGERDVFVHHSGIVGEGFKSLTEGQEVEFELVEDLKGERARNVTPVAPQA